MARFTNSDGKYTLALDVNEVSTNVANNTSTVSWALTLSSNGSYNFYGYTVSRNVYIDGSNVASIANQTGVSKGGSVTLSSGSTVVSHNSDGAKTVSVSASAGTDGSAYYLPSTISVSGALALTTLARSSDVVISNPKPRFGEQVKITINAEKSDYIHDVYVGADGHISWTKIANNQTGSFYWTVPLEYAKYYTTADNVLWLKIHTYRRASGVTTYIGEKVYWDAFQLQPTSETLPSGSIRVYDLNSKTKNLGIYVKGVSEISVTADGTAKYGAELRSTVVTYDGFEIKQSFIPQTAGTKEVKAVFTDSRNNQAVARQNIEIYDYNPPQINSVQFVQGKNSIEVKIKGAVDSLRGKNRKRLVIKYKAVDAYGFAERDVYIRNWSFTASQTITGIDTSKTYAFEVILSDAIGSDTKTNTTGIPVISRLAGGKGVTLFKEAEEEGFWIGNVDYTITDKEYAILMEMLS